MKIVILAVAMAELTCAAIGQTPAPMPVPVITAKTNSASKHIARTNTATTKTAQDSRTISVTTNVRFFTKPPAAYEVQCFFIAKNETTNARSIFDAIVQTSSDTVFATEFDSQPLAGGSKQWTAIPFVANFSGTVSDGGTFNGTVRGLSTSASATLGSKIEGWILRVVSGGKVLRIESNQPTLIEAAAKMSPALDAAAEAAKKQ